MLETMKKILDRANKGNYAVGAFNINNMEIIQAIIRAAESQKSPVIIQTSQGAIEYAGFEYIFGIGKIAAENTKIPMALHLDHGRDMNIIKKCIKSGYTSVMIDASHYDFEKNIRLTKKVVSMASKKGVTVEAELGTIGGAEETVVSRQILYTDPEKAAEFVKRTGCDALAIAIGTSHGAFKFAATPKLDIERLKIIKNKLKMPLVLHGASGVPQELVKTINKYGGSIKGTIGVPDSQIIPAVKNGINKINTDTDLRMAFTAAVRQTLASKKDEFDPRHILSPARDLIQKIVEHRMKVFGSVKKA